MNLKTGLLLSLMLMFVSPSQAQDSIPKEYTAKGQLATIRVVPGNKTAQIFLVGKEAVSMDLKNEPKIISVTLLQKQKRRQLELNQEGEAYVVKNLPGKGTEPFELLIQTQLRTQKEEVKVKVP